MEIEKNLKDVRMQAGLTQEQVHSGQSIHLFYAGILPAEAAFPNLPGRFRCSGIHAALLLRRPAGFLGQVLQSLTLSETSLTGDFIRISKRNTTVNVTSKKFRYFYFVYYLRFCPATFILKRTSILFIIPCRCNTSKQSPGRYFCRDFNCFTSTRLSGCFLLGYGLQKRYFCFFAYEFEPLRF